MAEEICCLGLNMVSLLAWHMWKPRHRILVWPSSPLEGGSSAPQDVLLGCSNMRFHVGCDTVAVQGTQEVSGTQERHGTEGEGNTGCPPLPLQPSGDGCLGEYMQGRVLQR